MKKIITAITLALFTAVAAADPCMDADVTPLGHSIDLTTDETHLDEHGC